MATVQLGSVRGPILARRGLGHSLIVSEWDGRLAGGEISNLGSLNG